MTRDAAHDGIIVMAPPRSGSTLLRRILNAHPDIACPGETNLFSACARFLQSETIAEGVDVSVLSGLAFAGFADEEVLTALREFAFGFHREYARRQGKSRWASKTVWDLFHLETIERFCGDDAYFICVQRHGLDVALSMKELVEATGIYQNELYEYVKRYPRPLEAFCHAWVDLGAATQAFLKRHPDNALLVKYEDLTADPESTTRQIASFVHAEWISDWMDRAMEMPKSIGLGDWKAYARTKVDTGSIGRWRNLSEYTISMMGRICNPMLEASGYPPVEVKEERSLQEARRRYELGMRVASRTPKARS
jgi:protein-tyrosine sulfotransferase